MRNDTKKKEEHIYPVMSPAQINQAVTPISPICPNSFLGPITLTLSPCDDCLSVICEPEKDFRPLTHPGLDLPTKSAVTFLSPISTPSKIPSNPASPGEPPSLTLLSTSQPPTINLDVAPSTLIGSQFPISSLEVTQSKDFQELPFNSLLCDV